MASIYNEPPKENDTDNPVRNVISAGTPRAIWTDFEKRFDTKIHEWYAVVEGGFAHNPPGFGPVGSFGKTPEGIVDSRIVDENDNELPPNTKGELVIRMKTDFYFLIIEKAPDSEDREILSSPIWLKRLSERTKPFLNFACKMLRSGTGRGLSVWSAGEYLVLGTLAGQAVNSGEKGWEACSTGAAIQIQDMACSLTTDGIQVMGGVGYMKDFGQEKRFRDAKQLQTLFGITPLKKLNFLKQLL